MEEPRDRVTITLYGAEQDVRKSLNAAMGEIPNIALIKTKLTTEAVKAARQAPEIVISVLLIPRWDDEKSGYENPTYKYLKEYYFREFNKFIRDNPELRNEEDVRIEDFYLKPSLSPDEKAYLQFLEARGSNADMIKTHAIICVENRNRRHLQMDSNTKIFDFELLYSETFGRGEQSDALNASYYDKLNEYVSAHNKIVYTAVYTSPGSQFSHILGDVHIQYCKTHALDHKENDTKTEKTQKNSIYSKDFVVALEKIGLTAKKILYPQSKNPQVVYLATLENKEAYRITRCVATAINMSWAANDNALAAALRETEKDLKQLPSVQVGDALCDYNCFANAVQKHAGPLTNHSDDPYDDSKAHNLLIEISSPFEKRVIKDFIEKVKMENPHLLKAVMDAILIHGERGEQLFLELFACDPSEYKEIAEQQKMSPRGK
ncbi:MAG: hypothetical protein SFW07_05685 [Gammaproteobacteria bacterium]|nr:hypothetical protein [Gammaproteobacteria bacterium]